MIDVVEWSILCLLRQLEFIYNVVFLFNELKTLYNIHTVNVYLLCHDIFHIFYDKDYLLFFSIAEFMS